MPGSFSLQYDRWGQAVDLPQGNTDTVRFRRYERLPKSTTPLTPGTTPTGSQVVITDVVASVSQYGDFVRFSDVVDDLNPDNILINLMTVVRRQWSETINEVSRNNIMGSSNVQYADASATRTNVQRSDITTADVFSKIEAQLAVRTLKLGGADKHTSYVKPSENYATSPLRPCYIAIVDPYTTNDLKNIPGFITPDKYGSQTALFEDEVGALDEIRFVEDTEGMIFAGEGAGGTVDVHATLVFGMNAYGTVKVSNTSTEVIVKPKTSGGPENPLNQYGTVGWKQYYVAKILNDDFLVRIEHAVSNQ